VCLGAIPNVNATHKMVDNDVVDCIGPWRHCILFCHQCVALLLSLSPPPTHTHTHTHLGLRRREGGGGGVWRPPAVST